MSLQGDTCTQVCKINKESWRVAVGEVWGSISLDNWISRDSNQSIVSRVVTTKYFQVPMNFLFGHSHRMCSSVWADVLQLHWSSEILHLCNIAFAIGLYFLNSCGYGWRSNDFSIDLLDYSCLRRVGQCLPTLVLLISVGCVVHFSVFHESASLWIIWVSSIWLLLFVVIIDVEGQYWWVLTANVLLWI